MTLRGRINQSFVHHRKCARGSHCCAMSFECKGRVTVGRIALWQCRAYTNAILRETDVCCTVCQCGLVAAVRDWTRSGRLTIAAKHFLM